jgi:hypothetical protein
MSGWALFVISIGSAVDGPIYVGVHMDTGETKIIDGDE